MSKPVELKNGFGVFSLRSRIAPENMPIVGRRPMVKLNLYKGYKIISKFGRSVCQNSFGLVEVVQLVESSVSLLDRFLVVCSKALHRMYIGDVRCRHLTL